MSSVAPDGAPDGRLAQGARRLKPALPVVVIASLLALVPFSTCGFRIFLGIPCPACGLTRATLAVARGDLAIAMRFQPLAPALLAAAALTVGAAFVLREPAWRRLVGIVTAASGLALLAVWALRFVGLFGGPVPG